MVIAVRTEEADGVLVVVKEARTDGDVARLTREAANLARAQHPGVVELLAVEDRRLVLRHGGTPISRLGPFPADHAAGIVGAVADIVHAVHRAGIAHRDLDADHVLLDADGRPKLCGFGQAAPADDAGIDADVGALGTLLSTLVEAGADLPWAGDPRGILARRRRRQARRELLALGAQARSGQRPTARQLAKAVHAALPTRSLPETVTQVAAPPGGFAEIPDDLDPTADLGWTPDDLSFLAHQHEDDVDDLSETPLAEIDRAALAPGAVDETVRATIGAPPAVHEPPAAPTTVRLPDPEPTKDVGPTGRRRLLVGAAAGVLSLGIVAGVAGARAVQPFADTPPTVAPAAPTTSDGTSAAQPEVRKGPAPTWPAGCDVPEPTGPDVDGDTCPDAIELVGTTATIGTVRIELGEPGDLVALGDWSCDGIDTPALLRPSTGEVFVFDAWSLREPLEVTASSVVIDATGIRASTDPCPVVVVRTAGGDVELGA